MSGELQLGDLEWREQEPRRRRRAHAAQLVGWALATAILVAALAGLFGPGPLSTATASAPLVAVGYERFARQLGTTTVVVTVRSAPAEPGVARLWISRDYVEKINVQTVVPQPYSWTAARDGVVLAFPALHGEATVRLRVRPDRAGLLRGAIGAPGRRPAEFWQFVYP
ncbi:hypothetical protein GCM10010106_17720 [Thermopolyspora flexuosa]|jgi:hypothetical protein|uniref:Uncharacterized protein n=1 Tax=Thermopolyspora flexuosa TaxID=103836 RepID=A0A543J484_9ACTN|nr:hypothetical protein [Thermopolyspora flexuosa]PZN13642.1 MAG: hypothetical protein DIU75_22495 [Mycolicibacterium hassiacum]TQM77640.1 hypothetical protein FHX40_4411 [Thermopolyspora flexuosa]GGM71831.1 hypothetical protein GCM10010106_17720 [Thermopolyspora flexuosa]